MSVDAPQKPSKKQAQIIETAQTLFLKHGVKRITVEEICRKAGVSKMTFYKHFPNKHALAESIWNGWIADGCAKLDEIDAQAIPFPEKLRRMFEYKLEWADRMSPESIEEFFALDLHHQPLIARFMQFVSDAQKRGEIRADLRPEFLLAVRQKLTELVAEATLVDLYPDYSDFVREVWDFFFYGILTERSS